ncbi:cell division cycle 20.2, cofactor of APC complex isoform X1 [Capsicum annuum]|uniref:cell division cycle 20.2, cofactor of APC complex isoform X1 n=1 Tax=Capsicum annuum TaxID=4072 RepID=UPI0007BF1F59|nr:cell division cycle 20.2, cofactor of APC complex isoform X1 [Capsicum annuum]
MDDNSVTRIQTDWYSPTRLLSTPVHYDFPGDRFIPNRSMMNLDQAHTLLTNTRTKKLVKPNFSDEYRRKMEENLNLDVQGRPFRMLVFRGSPKSCRQSTRLIDEMRRSDEEVPLKTNDTRRYRKFPLIATRTLDAPHLPDDYYSNIMDWGKSNILAVVLGPRLYIWNAQVQKAQVLMELMRERDNPTSVTWSDDGKTVAVGCNSSKLQLWDAETSKLVRGLQGHQSRVGCVAWKGHILTSGSKDRAIINHDVRARNSLVSQSRVHRGEVCGVKWSFTGNALATGGNDNLVYIWDISKMSSRHYMHRFNEHHAAVKALAWCPYNGDVLASGGGIDDGCLKIWNTRKGTCISTNKTGAQICGLQWNRHHKEILSGHGFGRGESHCQLCLWSYPSMARIGEPLRHTSSSRILHLSQSPDGLTVVSAGADETLRFWEIFGPPQESSVKITNLDNLLSLKASAVR